MSQSKRSKKASDWQLESPLDEAVTLEQLIEESPFKEASDEGGNSTTAGTRIPMWLNRRIIKLRELSGSPYELNSDVIRDALYIGLRVLHIRYKMGPEWHIETRLAAVVDATAATRRIRNQVGELIGGLEEMYNDGDTNKAVEQFTEYVEAASELEAGWHKEKVFTVLLENKVVRELLDYCRNDIQKLVKAEGKKKKKKKDEDD